MYDPIVVLLDLDIYSSSEIHWISHSYVSIIAPRIEENFKVVIFMYCRFYVSELAKVLGRYKR